MFRQRWILLSISLLSFVSLSGYGAYKIFWKEYDKAAPFQNSITVIIQPGQSARQIGSLLENAQVIDSSFTFFMNAILRRQASQLKAGEYEFPASRSIASVTKQLLQGKVVQHKITIPEGLTTKEIRTLLLKEEKLKGDCSANIEEGSLLPETYCFTRGETRTRLLNRMQKALKETLAYHWERHHHETALSSPQEVLILASIVEKETSKPSERPHVAGVFLNRLKQRMPLQACPTVIYGLEKLTGRPLDCALRTEDLTINTPFNTYIHMGLPPHPICHPGQASIESVLNPMVTTDLYFVADGTGGHVFSETFKEHQKNHARLRQIRQEMQKN